MEELLKGIASGAGVAGVILAYHLLVHARRMDEVKETLRDLENAVNTSSKADLLRLIASPHVASEVKDAAARVVKEIEGMEATTAKK